ncbi:MAG: phosphatidylglycerophosphatase A [Pseudomonadota bacterium]|nr:phosphatidylglycerophosphatase A [Pseudomonadota bacterium]
MSIFHDRAELGLNRSEVLLACWFGAGLTKKAPGTIGSLTALPFAAMLMMLGGAPLLAVAALVLLPTGAMQAERIGRRGALDPGYIVVDEVVGQWLALLPAALNIWHFAAGFALFRLFDIIKPGPIRILDQRVKGGWGVMTDDVAAGLVSAAILLGLRYFDVLP